MIKVGDEVILYEIKYVVTVNVNSPRFYLTNITSVGNNLIFLKLEIFDIFEFYNENNIINGYSREMYNSYFVGGLFPEVCTLEELQRLINILNEIVSHGTYKGYQRAQKLKLIMVLLN